MDDLLARLLDQGINRASGVYAGFTPSRPNALVIPRFVCLRHRIPSLVEALGEHLELGRLRRPLVISDPVTWEIAGGELFDGLAAARLDPRKALVESNRYSEAHDIIVSMNRGPRRWSEAQEPWERRLYGAKVPSVVFGVGGGTVVDMAKLVAFQLHLPCVSIPTSLANDGIASPFAVIRPPEGHAAANVTVTANTPLGVLIDLGRIKPRGEADGPFFERMMRSGIGDAVSNLTSTLDWRLAARRGEAKFDHLAWLHARSAGEVVLYRLAEGAPLDDDDLVLTLATGLVSSGEAMARVGSSQPASGFEHKLYHAYQNVLRFPSRATHGLLVAVGALVSAHAHGRWYEPMRQGFAAAGMPVDAAGLAALELTPERIEQAIHASMKVKPERHTILEERGPEALVASFQEVFGI
ncbi:MAG: iron-containing alcohol dehydrogenase [Pseudomonadota bacterium]